MVPTNSAMRLGPKKSIAACFMEKKKKELKSNDTLSNGDHSLI